MESERNFDNALGFVYTPDIDGLQIELNITESKTVDQIGWAIFGGLRAEEFQPSNIDLTVASTPFLTQQVLRLF